MFGFVLSIDADVSIKVADIVKCIGGVLENMVIRVLGLMPGRQMALR
jgi:hypothetical protein